MDKQPHPRIRPLPEHKAPNDCELVGITDEAWFRDSDGKWIPYWKDGRFATAEQVEQYRQFYKD